MSNWHEVTEEDITVDYGDDTVDIFAGWDEWGNRYISLTFKQIETLAERIKPE